MAALGPLSEPQLRLFFLIQTAILRFRPEGFGPVTDADVADAAGALAATMETAERGVLYEHRTSSAVADALRREIRALLDHLGERGGSRFEREASQVLRGIERGARHGTLGADAGPAEYLSLVRRVLQDPSTPESPPLIVPGNWD